MTAATKRHRKPAITVAQSDHDKLQRLADAASGRTPEVAEELLVELDRARVVPDEKLRPGIIRMGSTLGYSTEDGEERVVTLVFPGEADIAEGRISILTPIGTALIGLAAGQSIDWTARDGRIHRLKVEHVNDAGVSGALANEARPES